jgi:hypothetical protein
MDSIADSSSSAMGLYSPLADSDEIRLLCLQPRVSGGPIKCTIKHTRLSSKTPYEALSYMWGPEDTRSIEIDGRLCEIRVNLWQALFQLRDDTATRILWVDAVCINQGNIEERNHQVTQMGNIYSKASRVVVWLGESDASSSTAMGMLREAGLGKEFSVVYWRLFRNYSINALNDIRSIFLREYWSRLWIVQEVILAWEVILQCGTDVIAWDYLDSLVSCIDKIRLLNDGPIVPRGKAGWVESLRGSALAKLVRRRSSTKEMARSDSDDLGHSLLHLCSDHGAANCMDPRDKIFGLHALTRKCCADAVPIDYSLSLFQISTRVLSHHGLSHSSQPDIFIESQQFQDVLGISLEHGLTETSKALNVGSSFESSYNWPLFPVHCTSHSRVSYVDCFPQGENTGNQQPELEYWSRRRLLEIGEQLKRASASSTLITTQLGLVRPIGIELNFMHSTIEILINNPLRSTGYASKSVPRSDKDEFQQLLIGLRDVVSTNSGLAIRTAIDENGNVIFASSNVKVGDVLCQFELGQTLIILRPSQEAKDKCHLVGRAVTPYFTTLDSLRDIGKGPVGIQMNAQMLQILTLASHPDNDDDDYL